MADIELFYEGSLVGFKPVSDVGKIWMSENVQAEGWQWLGSVLYVDHRMADPIINGAFAEGLEIA